MKLSIILTALNEEGNVRQALEDLLQALDDFKIQGEILAFDDGSNDATGTIIDGMGKKHPRISFLQHKIPQGIGASFWEGVDFAEGDIVCWFPGDNETNAWEVLRYYPLLKDVDMVIPFIFNKSFLNRTNFLKLPSPSNFPAIALPALEKPSMK